MLKVGDIVRIIKQPYKQVVALKGKVGIIKEIEKSYCLFQEMSLDGSCCGSGTVHINCLELVDDVSKWHLVKGDY